jgi:hypothetical protein
MTTKFELGQEVWVAKLTSVGKQTCLLCKGQKQVTATSLDGSTSATTKCPWCHGVGAGIGEKWVPKKDKIIGMHVLRPSGDVYYLLGRERYETFPFYSADQICSAEEACRRRCDWLNHRLNSTKEESC